MVYLLKQDDAYVKDQSKEALNWSITVFIGMFSAGILSAILASLLLFPIIMMCSPLLSVILIGLLLLTIIMMCSLIFCIMGVVGCSSGKAFRVPFALRLIK